jgi:hypothetical protein
VDELTAAYADSAALREQVETLTLTQHDSIAATTESATSPLRLVELEQDAPVRLPDVDTLVTAVTERCEASFVTPHLERRRQLEEANVTLRRQLTALRNQVHQDGVALEQLRLSAEKASAQQHSAEASALKSSAEMVVLLKRERETSAKLQQHLFNAQTVTPTDVLGTSMSARVGSGDLDASAPTRAASLAQQLVACNDAIANLTAANGTLRLELTALRSHSHEQTDNGIELSAAKETILTLRAQLQAVPSPSASPPRYDSGAAHRHPSAVALSPEHTQAVADAVRLAVADIRRLAHSSGQQQPPPGRSLYPQTPAGLASGDRSPDHRRVVRRAHEYTKLREAATRGEVIISVLAQLLAHTTAELCAARALQESAIAVDTAPGHRAGARGQTESAEASAAAAELETVRDLLTHCQLDLEMSRSREGAAQAQVRRLQEKFSILQPLTSEGAAVVHIAALHDVLAEVMAINGQCVPRLFVGTQLIGVRCGQVAAEAQHDIPVPARSGHLDESVAPRLQTGAASVALHRRIAQAEETVTTLQAHVRRLMASNTGLQQKLEGAHATWTTREKAIVAANPPRPAGVGAACQTVPVHVSSTKERRIQADAAGRGDVERSQLQRELRQAVGALKLEKDGGVEMRAEAARQRKGHQAELDRMRAAAASLREKIVESTSEMTALRTKSDQLQSRVVQLEARRKSDTAVIAGLRTRIEKAEAAARKHTDRSGDIEDLGVEVKRLSAQLRSRTAQLETARRDVAVARREEEAVSEQRDSLQRQVRDLERVRSELDSVRDRNRTLTVAKTELEASVHEAGVRVDALEAERDARARNARRAASRASQTTGRLAAPAPRVAARARPMNETVNLHGSDLAVPTEVAGNVQRILNLTGNELDDLMSSIALDTTVS